MFFNYVKLIYLYIYIITRFKLVRLFMYSLTLFGVLKVYKIKKKKINLRLKIILDTNIIFISQLFYMFIIESL